MEPSGSILIVDDEKDIRDAVRFTLFKEGFDTEEAANGIEAINKVMSGHRFDLIIMDIIMPYMPGTDVAKEIRKTTQCPILFLTAKSSDDDKVEAYSSGGDDYLSKPFSSVELILRVNALIKRCGRAIDKEEISIDTKYRKVLKNGAEVQLTDKEFDLLCFLHDHRGQAFSNSELYENVWQEKYMQASANTVMVHILNLRKKLEDDFTKPRFIQTIWGKGYCYAK